MSGLFKTYRTRNVHFGAFPILMFAVLISALSMAAFAQSLQQNETAGWLQLKSEQMRYRERAQPLEPRNKAYLEHLEDRQGLQLRGLQSHQRQILAIERMRRRTRYPHEPARVAPRPQQGRELQGQRLNRLIQRETFGAGRW